MHRNTLLIIGVLSLLAVLLLGINIGRKIPFGITQPTSSPTPTAIPAPQATAKPSATPKILKEDPAATGSSALKQTYTNTGCGFSLKLPPAWTYTEADPTTVTISNPANPTQQITIACQADIPRPPVQTDLIEKVIIDGVEADLYHDASAKDGTAIDAIVARIPGKSLDIFITGSGKTFEQILATFTFTPPVPPVPPAPTTPPTQ